jgi:hypothetical protein
MNEERSAKELAEPAERATSWMAVSNLCRCGSGRVGGRGATPACECSIVRRVGVSTCDQLRGVNGDR